MIRMSCRHSSERQFRKQFEIVTALGPVFGLETLADKGRFAIVVSDLRMPGMDGIDLPARVADDGYQLVVFTKPF